MTPDNKRSVRTDFTILCENEGDCGSPVWAYLTTKWIFESNRFEQRVVCGGCEYVQSREYTNGLVSGKIKEPIYTGYDWVYPDTEEYQEWIHYTEHEPLIKIKGRKIITTSISPAREYG